MDQTAFHLMNYKINLHLVDIFKIPFKQWDALSESKIQKLILLLIYNAKL